MAEFSERERTEGMDLLEATEDLFVQLGAPSQLAVGLLRGFIAGTGADPDGPMQGIVGGIALMGYSCRMLAEADVELPEQIEDAIDAQLLVDEQGDTDVEATASDPERVGKLLEYGAVLADNVGAISRLVGVTENVWQSFATVATYQLQKNLKRNGLPRRALPSGEMIENVLRLGVALRVLDEVAMLDPVAKELRADR